MKDKNYNEIYAGCILWTQTFGLNSEVFCSIVIQDSKNGEYKLNQPRSIFYYGQKNKDRLDDSIIIGDITKNPELAKYANLPIEKQRLSCLELKRLIDLR